jgi:hypothetical protein
MDTCFAYGQNPSMLRERYYEAHDLVMRAWTEQDTFAFNGRYAEHVDDDHAAAMAGGAFDQRRAGDFLVAISVVPSLFAGRRLMNKNNRGLSIYGTSCAPMKPDNEFVCTIGP